METKIERYIDRATLFSALGISREESGTNLQSLAERLDRIGQNLEGMNEKLEKTSDSLSGEEIRRLFPQKEVLTKELTEKVDNELESIHKSLEDVFVEAKVSSNVLRSAIDSISREASLGDKQAQLLLGLSKQSNQITDILDRFFARQEISQEEADKVIDFLKEYASTVQEYSKKVSIDIKQSIDALTDIIANQDLSREVRVDTFKTVQGLLERLKQEQLGFIQSLNLDNLAENTSKIEVLVKDNEKAQQLYLNLFQAQDKEKEEILSQLKDLLRTNIENNDLLNSLMSLDEKSLTLDERQTNEIVKNLKRVADYSYGYKINDTLANIDRSMDKLVLQSDELESTLKEQTKFGQSIEDFFRKHPHLASLGESAKEEVRGYLGPVGEILQATGLDEKMFSFLGRKASSLFSRFGGRLGKFGLMSKFLGGAEKGLVKEVGEIGGKGLLAKIGLKEGESLFAKLGTKIGLKEGGGLLAKLGLKEGAKFFGKFGLKSIAKKIPFLGAAAGGIFAIQRLMKGDILGGLGELASGIASTLPGVGTLVSTGIDTALAYKDIKEEMATPKLSERTISEKPQLSKDFVQNMFKRSGSGLIKALIPIFPAIGAAQLAFGKLFPLELPKLSKESIIKPETVKEITRREGMKEAVKEVVRTEKESRQLIINNPAAQSQREHPQEGVDDSDLLIVRSLLFAF